MNKEAMEGPMTITYHHPVFDADGKPLSTANIIWADRNLGDAYYRVSKFAMRNGKFPSTHPCAPLDSTGAGSQMGDSAKLAAFRARGYWASCFPEGDGITLYWWPEVAPLDRTAEQVVQDIKECFGWEVVWESLQ